MNKKPEQMRRQAQEYRALHAHLDLVRKDFALITDIAANEVYLAKRGARVLLADRGRDDVM